ncbi:hypothetical protein CEUSTIGMA_g10715.t1 [Chlamydomonas eustigma]|uniref:Cytochrome c oxidase polypeptide II n=1 Tax=Chlamydomonas eustigma TaxID=1157962 RepID=A0A250XK33_9CHLO|nr:hypothetical protein CEUSTIGMA_g10715.t1 [Chlamydomonas eustigma]|eukprot:GAX83289.1 hypothetical protein CEUSTIGMA_g10715.t1 [Chlamydomonas eustigma]
MLQAVPFALRLGQGCKAESKLLWNAAMFSSTSNVSSANSEMEVVSYAEKKVAQYSASEAAALAEKKKYLGTLPGGLGSITLGNTTSWRSPFSSMRSVSTSTAATASAVTAEETAPQKSLWRRLAAAAAAVVGAVALAVAPPAAADAPAPWQFGFQDSASSTAQAAHDLHHDVMFFVITISVLVLYLTFQFATKFHYSFQGPLAEKITHNTALEVAWTVFPTLVVLLIAIPSLTLIYSMDQHNDRPGLTVKVIGRQWYWSYEMHDHLQHKLVDPDRLVAIAEKSLTRA